MPGQGKLPYHLVPSSVLNKKTPYYARTLAVRTVGREELITIMAEANTTLTRQDILGCLDLLEEKTADVLRQGFSLDTGIFTARVNLRGAFAGSDDSFDPKRHSLHLRLGASPAFKKRVLRSLKPVRGRNPGHGPSIMHITDFTTGSRNSRLTSGGLAEIKGRGLRYDRDRNDCGFFLVEEKGGPHPGKKYRPASLERLTDRTALIRLPASMPAGACNVGMDKQYMESTTGVTLTKPLTVEKKNSD
ncbi:MAG: DUF4469 domain-containing protein [Spirochaetales bacterium]|nr:DUF4469 domain-containing protein [Spirochaetales bacterium]